jgi:hypothetical protein
MGSLKHDVEQTMPAIRAYSRDPKAKVRMMYDATDPYAVTIDFMNRGDTASWQIARDLLRDGQNEQRGHGDIIVCPSPRRHGTHLEITLRGEKECAQFDIPIKPLTDFLDRTYQLVPSGKESAMLEESLELAIQQLFNT